MGRLLLALLLMVTPQIALAKKVNVQFDFAIAFEESNKESHYYGSYAPLEGVSWFLEFDSGTPGWVDLGIGGKLTMGMLSPQIVVANNVPSGAKWRLNLIFEDAFVRFFEDGVLNRPTKMIQFESDDFDEDLFVDFGRFLYGKEGKRHPLLQAWSTAQLVKRRYEQVVEPWPYGKIPVNVDANNTANFSSPVGIYLRQTAANSFRKFAHEMGHWIMKEDARRETIPPSYCYDLYLDSTYPWNQAPYIYEDPDGECEHYTSSAEHPELASTEGYAHFLSFLLLGHGVCHIDGHIFPQSAETPPFRFDTIHSEILVAGALCDLIDPGLEVASVRHLYADPADNFALIYQGTQNVHDYWSYNGIAMNATQAFRYASAPNTGTDTINTIYAVDFQSGQESKLITFETKMGSNGVWPQATLAASDQKLCYANSRSDLYCYTFSDGTTSTYGVSANERIIDVAVHDHTAYVIIYDLNTEKKRLSQWDTITNTKTLLYQQQYVGNATSGMNQIAAEDSKNLQYLFVGYNSSQIQLFDLNTGMLYPWTGLKGDGYAVGNLQDARFTDIQDLAHMAGVLYVTDSYGVRSIYEDTSNWLHHWVVEQIVGIAEDDIYENVLSPRSLSGDAFRFATNGLGQAFVAGNIQYFDQHRIPFTDARAYRIEDLSGFVVEDYCGNEFSTMPIQDVVHAYQGIKTDASFTELLWNIPGMTGSIMN